MKHTGNTMREYLSMSLGVIPYNLLMSLPGWMRCCGAGAAASSSARPLMVFSRVPPFEWTLGS